MRNVSRLSSVFNSAFRTPHSAFRKPPAGIEPTRPSYQDGKLPLHHKGVVHDQLALNESAQWESNPHVRHGKAIGYRYIMGAIIINQ